MGLEYRICIANYLREKAKLDSLLRSLTGFAGFDEKCSFYNYTEPRNSSGMPNASIKLESDFIYLVDHCGTKEFIDLLKESLEAYCEGFLIQDLE